MQEVAHRGDVVAPADRSQPAGRYRLCFTFAHRKASRKGMLHGLAQEYLFNVGLKWERSRNAATITNYSVFRLISHSVRVEGMTIHGAGSLVAIDLFDQLRSRLSSASA